jgi:hypothetical protein
MDYHLYGMFNHYVWLLEATHSALFSSPLSALPNVSQLSTSTQPGKKFWVKWVQYVQYLVSIWLSNIVQSRPTIDPLVKVSRKSLTEHGTSTRHRWE